MIRFTIAFLATLASAKGATAQERPYLTTPSPITLLSANDGELRYLHTATGASQQVVDDSFTVIHLDPEHPPIIETVEGKVPATIHGSPHIAITHDGDNITHLHRIKAKEGLGPIEEAFSPRISPDGKTAIVLHDHGIGGQGSRDDILIVNLGLKKPAVTQRVRQVGDGLESLAFHPSGKFAVICCLDKGPDVAMTSHLATIDLTTNPARLRNHLPIEPVPEGIEFTADGSMLFVQATLANHIVVFDVDNMELRRSPYVLCTGHAPSSMAISRRYAE